MRFRNLQCHYVFAVALTATLVGCGGGDEVEGSASGTDAPQEAAPQPARESVAAGPDPDESAEQEDQSMASAAEATAMASDSETDDRTQAAGSENVADSADPCTVALEVGDSIAYDRDSISVPSSCSSVTIELSHTGSLPKEAMGHNWVLVPPEAAQAIGTAATSAGLENEYLPDDERIVAATDLVGGGESTSLTFSLADLDASTTYEYICTFPGHWSVMRGTFSIE